MSALTQKTLTEQSQSAKLQEIFNDEKQLQKIFIENYKKLEEMLKQNGAPNTEIEKCRGIIEREMETYAKRF